MLDVKVKIDLVKPIGTAGFGLPLILEENATAEKAYTECRTLADVEAAGYASTTKTYKAVNAMLMQEDAPEKFAVCATASPAATWLGEVANTAQDWRQLVVVNNSETVTDVAEIMKAIETVNNKMYFADLAVDDSTALTVDGIERTVLFYCNATEEYPSPAAALVGATAGMDAGSFTYKNIIIKGIAPQNLTATEVEAIHAKGGITFVTKAGDNVTTEGKVAGGEFIDIVDSKDYIVSNLEYQTQKVLNNSAKIPYDDNGIALLESVAVNVMKDAYNKGIIATNEDGSPAYAVDYALRSQVSDGDRVARKYAGGQFSFTLAGAVHTVEVTGEIII